MIMRSIIVALSSFFRLVTGGGCKFHPTCSRYSAQAYGRYGFFKASWLTFKRLSRCHPFSQGGYDPLN